MPMESRDERNAMNSSDISPEQLERAKACKSPEELLAVAREEGYELSDDQLEAIAGGGVWDGTGDSCKEEHCDTYCPTAWHA